MSGDDIAMKDKYNLMRKQWTEGYRTVLTCPHCSDSIFSAKSGQYVSCSCGAFSIDQTPQYCRIIGDWDSNVKMSQEKVV